MRSSKGAQKVTCVSSSNNAHFEIDRVASGLERRSARGAAQTILGQTVNLILRLGGGALLARLLRPADFGLLAMVGAVIGILTVFGDLGLSTAAIQRPEIDQRQMSTLFWLNVALGALLSGLVVLIAPSLAWFYGDDRLISITLVLGAGFFAAGLGVQHFALLTRQMRFGVLSAIGIVSSIISLLVGISLAWLQCGYWSLVWMQLAGGVVSSSAAWMACGWRPGMATRWTAIRSMVVFGGNLTLFSALNYLARNFDNVLIGWRWGAEPLGQYARAYNLMMLPLGQINSPISSVAIPALSRLQSDPARYRNYYTRCLNMVSYIMLPAIVGMFIFSEDIVRILLGPQWSQATSVFRILTVAAFLQPLSNTAGWLYISLGRTNEMAKWGLISVPCFVCAFFVGLPWGPIGVAIAYAAACWAIMYPCLAMAVRGTPISVKDLWVATCRPLCLAILAGLVMYACRLAFASYGMVWMFMAAITAVTIVVLSMRHASDSVRIELGYIIRAACLTR
jgi:PST family polysaccharide transporter